MYKFVFLGNFLFNPHYSLIFAYFFSKSFLVDWKIAEKKYTKKERQKETRRKKYECQRSASLFRHGHLKVWMLLLSKPDSTVH